MQINCFKVSRKQYAVGRQGRQYAVGMFLLLSVYGILLTSFFSGRASETRQLRSFIAPTVLPNVTTEMKTPGFWISRLKGPDRVVMTPDEIQTFNRTIVESKLRTDIPAFPDTYSGPELKDAIKKQINGFAAAGYFTQDGRAVTPKFFNPIAANIGADNIPELITVRFAVTVRNADQRLLPTDNALTAKPLDIDFDELQNNALDLNTPVAVLWQTVDRRWSFTVGPSSSGWILSEDLALCRRADLPKINDVAVITEAKADVYLDRGLRRYYGFVRMGARFAIKNFSNEIAEVEVPLRDENGRLKMTPGFIQTKELHRGHLPYTPRTVIEQAFEMLNTPYGWGGANGEQDCSHFLQEVFATVGVELPRNSSDQAASGTVLYQFNGPENEDRRTGDVLANARPGLSLLSMKGHIMLYLGAIDAIPYAIHDTWAYREPINGNDTPMVINKVTVSDLGLGRGSQKGPLLNRLKSIICVCK
jgi:hypothetical protein